MNKQRWIETMIPPLVLTPKDGMMREKIRLSWWIGKQIAFQYWYPETRRGMWT